MSITINCIVCGKELLISPSRYSENGNCCSRECISIKNSGDNNVTCHICGKDFHLKPFAIAKRKNKNSICCSKECSNIDKSNIMLGYNNHQFGKKGELNTSFKSDIKFNSHGYIQVRDITHPCRNKDDFILLHRLIYEEHAKVNGDYDCLYFDETYKDYFLSSDYIIHHVDGNKLNNTISNLSYMCRSDHSVHHNIERPRDRDEITQRFIESGKIMSGTITKKHDIDAGLDISSAEQLVILPKTSQVVSTGTRISIPEGCVGFIWSRSGLSVKNKIEVGAGCIDAGYIGEIKVHLYNYGDYEFKVEVGDRIAQLITIPINLNTYEQVNDLLETGRGIDGFGSTGK